MPAKKTWLQRNVEWLENHRIWGRVLLVTFILGVLGGNLSFINQLAEVGRWLFTRDATELRIRVDVQNARSNALQIEPLCTFEVVETTRTTTATYFGLGELARLSPTGSFTGTNAFHLRSGDHRAYHIRLPNSQLARDLIVRQASRLVIKVEDHQGGSAVGEMPLKHESIRKQSLLVKFSP